MYWRRFALSSIPIHDAARFEAWLAERWREKDALLEGYVQNGRFPADEGHDCDGEPGQSKIVKGAGFIETSVQLGHFYELGSIFVVLSALALVANIGARIWNLYRYGNMKGLG